MALAANCVTRILSSLADNGGHNLNWRRGLNGDPVLEFTVQGLCGFTGDEGCSSFERPRVTLWVLHVAKREPCGCCIYLIGW